MWRMRKNAGTARRLGSAGCFLQLGDIALSGSVNDGGNGTILKAVSAVQAVLLMDDAGTALVNRFLRTDTDAFSTADTAVGGVKWSGLNLETIKSLVDDTAFDPIQPVVGQCGEILPVTDYACSLC